MLNGTWSIILSILVFALMIAIHEFGHFSAAKLFGIRVNQFAIGMGPVILKKQRGETLYSVRAIPIGGFCQMEGEDEESDDERSFSKAPWYKQFVVVFAGAFLNLVLGFIIFAIIQMTTPYINTTTIADFVTNTNLESADIHKGDKVIALGDTKINIYEDLAFELNRITDKPVDVTLKRGNETITKTITPVKQEITYVYGENEFTLTSHINSVLEDTQTIAAPDSEEYKALIGTTQTQHRYILGFVPTQQKQTFFSSLRNAFYLTIYNIKIVYVSLYELITGTASVSQISGPIGIINVIGQASKMSMAVLFELIALLTVNLGIMNLLPIPALDGGKLFSIIVQTVTRKKLSQKAEGVIQLIGFAILISIMIFATYNDILRLFTK